MQLYCAALAQAAPHLLSIQPLALLPPHTPPDPPTSSPYYCLLPPLPARLHPQTKGHDRRTPCPQLGAPMSMPAAGRRCALYP